MLKTMQMRTWISGPPLIKITITIVVFRHEANRQKIGGATPITWNIFNFFLFPVMNTTGTVLTTRAHPTAIRIACVSPPPGHSGAHVKI